MTNLKKNDEIVTHAGIIGVVANIKDDEITLKIDDNATMQAHCAAPPTAPTVYCPAALGVNPTLTSGHVLVARSLPNPFHENVSIAFTLPKDGNVRVDVFGTDGRLVDTVANGPMAAGFHNLTWKLARETPSGMYFYKVTSNGATATGKLTRVD